MLREQAERESSREQEPLRRAFEEHYEPLLRLCVLLTGHREDAEEIVQEAFMRTANSIGSLSPEAAGGISGGGAVANDAGSGAAAP